MVLSHYNPKVPQIFVRKWRFAQSLLIVEHFSERKKEGESKISIFGDTVADVWGQIIKNNIG